MGKGTHLGLLRLREWCILAAELLRVSLLEFWAAEVLGMSSHRKPVGTSLSQSVFPFAPTTLLEISFFRLGGSLQGAGQEARFWNVSLGFLARQPLSLSPLPPQCLLQ